MGGNSSAGIAIVGIACRFPGASDLTGFWRLLRNGIDAITEIPKERWDVEALYDPRPEMRGKTRNRFAGLIEGIDQFDAQFLGQPPRRRNSFEFARRNA